MKKIQFILLVVFAFLSCNAIAQTSSADQLKSLLESYSTYQANFNQLTYSGRNSQAEASSGRFMIMRPNKFRWETIKPMRQIVIANGKTLWVYYVDLAQATKEKISSSTGINPAMLLTGKVSELLTRFTITRIPGAGQRFQLTSKDKKSAFQSVQLWFDDGKLTFIKAVNNLGQTSTFHFSHIRTNSRLNPKLFIFKVPPGVDVLTN